MAVELRNDTCVFEVFAVNPGTGRDEWRGVATLNAARLAGCRVDPASWMYHPKALLSDGWAIRTRWP
jgi:hypothetical protein